jgi:hypothetical protein
VLQRRDVEAPSGGLVELVGHQLAAVEREGGAVEGVLLMGGGRFGGGVVGGVGFGWGGWEGWQDKLVVEVSLCSEVSRHGGREAPTCGMGTSHASLLSRISISIR